MEEVGNKYQQGFANCTRLFPFSLPVNAEGIKGVHSPACNAQSFKNYAICHCWTSLELLAHFPEIL